MIEWHWPQIVMCIGMSLRTIKLYGDALEHDDEIDRKAGRIFAFVLAAATAYILHKGGFW